MTRRISLIITVVGVALTFAIPTAWSAERQGPGNLAVSPEVFELTVSGNSKEREALASYYKSVFSASWSQDAPAHVIGDASVISDALDRESALTTGLGSKIYGDASDRVAISPQSKEREALASYYKMVFSTTTGPVGDSHSRVQFGNQPVVGDSHGRVDLGNSPASSPTISSGTEIEWPQVGIGFGVGILLALGLGLAVRLTRVPPLAH